MKHASSSVRSLHLAVACCGALLLFGACAGAPDESDPGVAAPVESASMTSALTAPREVSSARPPLHEALIRTWHDPRPPPESLGPAESH
jgi:hypothetical protein